MNRQQLITWGQVLSLSAVAVVSIYAHGSFDLAALVLGIVSAAAAFAAGRLFVDLVARRDTGDRPRMWRDVKVLALAAQIFAVCVLYTVFGYLWSNFRDRADSINLKLGFDFLDQPGGITIADNPLSANDTVREAIQEGLLNTVRIIIVGIPMALVLGTLIGIARLSSNWLLRKLATAYVEFFRNIPPLVVIFFIWSAVYLNGFPPSRESWKPVGEWFIFNNSRFAFPSIASLDNFTVYRWIILGAVLLAGGVWWWRTRVFDQTGTPHRRALWALGTFVGIAAVGFVALGGPVELSKPTIGEAGRVYTGGIKMQMPYAALGTALVIYTATHIAEIVRGSILAVHKGQVEAANALALSGVQRYRFVILPQAMRIAFPPLINQMLNFSKNSSLALAIGFAEVTSVINNLFGQSQPAPQLILILMLSYLALSLIISMIGNLVNRRLQIVGR